MSSWCFWSQPTWAELKRRYADRVEFDWKIALMDGAGLPKSAFHVSEDGRSQTISHFYSEEVPLELVVAVDMSGSMESAMPQLKKAASDFLGAVPSCDRVTLLGFNDAVFTLARAATEPAARLKAVTRLKPWGGTLLYDARFHLVDLGTQLKPLIEGFYGSRELRTCKKCQHVFEPPR